MSQIPPQASETETCPDRDVPHGMAVTCAEQSRPRVLVFVHGALEHTGRYRHLVTAAQSRGWGCVAVDLPGHGVSPFEPLRQRGSVVVADMRSFTEYERAIRTIVETGKRLRTTLPERIAIFAHSLGGLAAIRMMQKSMLTPMAAVVLSAPFLGEARRQPAWKLTLGRILRRVYPSFRFAIDLDPNDLSDDPAVIKAWLTDPMIHTHVTARWYFAVQDAMRQAHADASKWRPDESHDSQPNLLVVQGTADRVTDAAGVRRWFDQVPLPQVEPDTGDVSHAQRTKSWIEIPGGRHECFNERAWQERFDQVLNWLDRSIPPA